MNRLRWLLIGLCLVSTSAMSEVPRVLVSIAPVHSLVAAVMRGAGEPQLLVAASQSAHHVQLRPSQIRAIGGADLIVWVGPSLERFLVRALKSAKPSAGTLAFTDTAGLSLLPFRSLVASADAQTDQSDSHRHDHKHGHDHDSFDPHVWLDPQMAGIFARAVASRLAQIDPTNERLYQNNLNQLIEQLRQLTEYGRVAFEDLRDRPLLVHHDAYQYFEKRFGLTGAQALLLDDELPVSAAHYARTERYLRQRQVRCVLTEPQMSQSVINSLAGSVQARVGRIDPLGADIASGPDLYPELMRRMIDTIRDCLSAD